MTNDTSSKGRPDGLPFNLSFPLDSIPTSWGEEADPSVPQDCARTRFSAALLSEDPVVRRIMSSKWLLHAALEFEVQAIRVGGLEPLCEDLSEMPDDAPMLAVVVGADKCVTLTSIKNAKETPESLIANAILMEEDPGQEANRPEVPPFDSCMDLATLINIIDAPSDPVRRHRYRESLIEAVRIRAYASLILTARDVVKRHNIPLDARAYVERMERHPVLFSPEEIAAARNHFNLTD